MAKNVVVRNAEGEDVVYENVSGVELITEGGSTAIFIHSAEIRYENLPDKPELAPVATKGTYASLKDKPFFDVPVPLVEAEVAFSPMEEFTDTYMAALDGEELLLGQSYIVKWDGTEYTCVCRSGLQDDGNGINGLVLGNTTKAFWPLGEDTGEPFLILWTDALGANTDETDATHTISITPVNTVQKMDAKYLPDGLATEGFVEKKIAEIEIPEGSGGGITAADVTAMLASAGVIVPVAVEDNMLLSDSNNDIYIL